MRQNVQKLYASLKEMQSISDLDSMKKYEIDIDMKILK